MLERMKHEKTVDIYGHVTCMRAQRNYMVQTEDQYIFIHEALLEAATCGNTEVPARNLYAHIQKLTQPPSGETVTAMELEFKVTDKHWRGIFLHFSLHFSLLQDVASRLLPFWAVFSESTQVPLSSRTAECHEKQDDNYCANVSLSVFFKPLKSAFVWKLGEFVLINRNGGATFAFFFKTDRCGPVYAECMFDIDAAWIASPGSGSRRPEP